MSMLNQAEIETALQQVIDPASGVDLVSLGAVQSLSMTGNSVQLIIRMGYPCAGIKTALHAAIVAKVASVAGVEQVNVVIEVAIAASGTHNTAEALPGVKNIIAVASGKGGVGKSTTAVNLALALSAEGAKVGILDADIYGPSVPQMLGVGDQRPEMHNDKTMRPVMGHGIQTMSMGYLVTEQTPMAWRGPMVSGALIQLLTQTYWLNLDYLIIDMPPGTGDIQLTLSQKVPVTGAVIVTTPQDIALLDAKKGIEMFRKVNIPVLGVVENMATHICSQCGHEEHIFGEGGGLRIAQDYQTQLLGALPLTLAIREDADGGKPSVVANPESNIAQTYRTIARKLGAILWQSAGQATSPVIEFSED